MKKFFAVFICCVCVFGVSCSGDKARSETVTTVREKVQPLKTLYAVGDIDHFDLNLAPLARKLVKDDPDGKWLILGDGGYGDSDSVTENYQEILSVIDEKNIMFVIGDHDYGTQDPGSFDDEHLATTRVKNLFETHDVFSLALTPSNWQIVGVNDNCVEASSPDAVLCNQRIADFTQKVDAAKSTCSIATWHHPIFAVIKKGGTDLPQSTAYGVPLYNAAFDAGVDIILNGDHHHFLASKNIDRNGKLIENEKIAHIREFIVGTGGAPISANENTPKLAANATDEDIRLRNGVAKIDLYDTYAVLSFVTIKGILYSTKIECN